MANIRNATAAIEQAAQDEVRAKLERDQAIYDAWHDKATWAEIMSAAGLSRRGVQLALDRMRTRLGVDFEER